MPFFLYLNHQGLWKFQRLVHRKKRIKYSSQKSAFQLSSLEGKKNQQFSDSLKKKFQEEKRNYKMKKCFSLLNPAEQQGKTSLWVWDKFALVSMSPESLISFMKEQAAFEVLKKNSLTFLRWREISFSGSCSFLIDPSHLPVYSSSSLDSKKISFRKLIWWQKKPFVKELAFQKKTQARWTTLSDLFLHPKYTLSRNFIWTPEKWKSKVFRVTDIGGIFQDSRNLTLKIISF